jgi:hypothetical protein
VSENVLFSPKDINELEEIPLCLQLNALLEQLRRSMQGKMQRVSGMYAVLAAVRDGPGEATIAACKHYSYKLVDHADQNTPIAVFILRIGIHI